MTATLLESFVFVCVLTPLVNFEVFKSVLGQSLNL